MRTVSIVAGASLLLAGCVLAVSLGTATFQGGSDAWWGTWSLGVAGAALLYRSFRRTR